MTLFHLWPWMDTLLALALGACYGSYLNVVIYRRPQRKFTQAFKEAVGDEGCVDLLARSSCPHCGAMLKWHENVPVLSYIKLMGKCSTCAAPISARYPLFEATCGGLFGLVTWLTGVHPFSYAACALVCLYLAALIIDMDGFPLPRGLVSAFGVSVLATAGLGYLTL